MEQTKNTNVSKTIKDFFGNVMNALLSIVINALDWIMDPIQRKIGMKRMAYVFLLPNMLIFGIFVLFPMLVNIYYSFTGGTNLFPQDRPFVGLENFRVLFTCENFLDPNTCTEDLFWRAVYNTIKFVSFQVVGIVLFSLITALILNRKIVARGFFRSVYFYPVLLSPVVVALIWKWILQRDGLFNAMIIGLGGERINFLLNSDWATFWVIFISIWANMGFFTLILLAGLQSIPPDLYEAGSMDGTNEWQSFRHITLPLLMPTMLVVLVLSLIRAVQVFDQVYVLTGGGPGSATLYMVQYIYNKGFSDQIHIFGLAAAASVIMAVVLMVFTLLQLYLSRRSDAV
ncbi:MAG: sugar ABC transporter permease [Anaerolineaceae bacterium]|nr:sugar ABC transporter permease [Anaerolineaceae bacterium]